MNKAFDQKNRLGQLHTPLAFNRLALLSFSGVDRVNGMFDYVAEALTATDDINPDDLLGLHASVELVSHRYDSSAWFDGIVTEINRVGRGRNGVTYSLRLQPWLFLMSLRQNQRIFHEKTAPEILKEVFAAYASSGKTIFRDDLTKSYPTLEYTVQYRETDLAFALRLMERFGISHYAEHEQGDHTIVLTDAVDSHPKVVGNTRPYRGVQNDHLSDEEHFWAWSPRARMATGAIRLTEFNFKTPDQNMEVEQTGQNTYAQGKLESYEFPGDYLEPKAGETRAGLLVDQAGVGAQLHRAMGNCLTLKAGMKVKIDGDKRPGVTGETFLCVEKHHSYDSGGYGTGGDGSGSSYEAEGMFQLDKLPLVPARTQPPPMIAGPQTAKVVGEGEIDVDEYGRILVHFPWDLDNAHSMRCRVSQNWAHGGWGGMVIPRIGMEVLVDFIEGHPDQPLVTGCVYNHENMPTYALPDDKTKTVFRTDTHEGDGYNELTFEDQDGKQEIYIRAMMDMNSKIENNRTEHININKVESVGNNKASEIANNSTEVIGGDLKVRVGPGQAGMFTPGGAEKNPEGIGNVAYAIDDGSGNGSMELSVENNRTVSIGKNDALSVADNRSDRIGRNHTIDVGETFTLDAGKRIILKCGQSEVMLDSGGNISVNGVKISMKAQDLFKVMSKLAKIN